MSLKALFIPGKGKQQYTPQDDSQKMLAIQNWAGTVISAVPVLEGPTGFTFGGSPPADTPTTIQSDSILLTVTAGAGTIVFPKPFQYGYIALVASGNDLFCQVVSVDAAGGVSLTQLPVKAYDLTTGPVSGGVVVNYIAVGA